MFNFLKKSFGFGSMLGVDIGTASVKISEIAKEGGKLKLKNYGILESYNHLERLNSAIQTNSLKILEKETAELLKALVEKAGFKSKDAILSIPIFSCFTVFFEVPEMSDADLNKAMSFQISQYIPLPASEVAVDWLEVGKREIDGSVKRQILLISIPKEAIERHKNIFKLAGLNLRSVEMEGFSLTRALVGEDPTPTLIVDIGAYSTAIVVSDGGFLKSARFTETAGSSFTRAIAGGLNISAKRAEELKKLKGLKASGGEYELSTLPQIFIDDIIRESLKSRDDYLKAGGSKIERVMLAGGSANLVGIDEYFEKQTGIPTIVGNAFLNVSFPEGTELLIKELGPMLAVSIGAGIKNFSR